MSGSMALITRGRTGSRAFGSPTVRTTTFMSPRIQCVRDVDLGGGLVLQASVPHIAHTPMISTEKRCPKSARACADLNSVMYVPTGFCFGQYRRASASLMMATCEANATSVAVKALRCAWECAAFRNTRLRSFGTIPADRSARRGGAPESRWAGEV